MIVLVTGGAGVIGSSIVSRLITGGHRVAVVDPCEEKRNQWIAERTIGSRGLLELRIERSPEIFRDYIREFDAVIHAAASTGIPYSVQNSSDDWERNVDATRVLLEALRINPKPTVILSSIKPYAVPDDIVERGGLREDDPLVPDEPYAASKAAQSMLAMAYARSYDLPIVTFRCSNLYGPAPCHGPRHGWLTWFAICAAIGRPIEVQGTGEQTRDMLHGDDVYRACMLAIESADRLKGRVFNLGGGKDNRISVMEAAKWFAEKGGVDIVHGPARAMDDLHVFANSGAFLRETGWLRLVNLREGGMLSMFEWAKANADSLRELYKDA